MKKKIHYGDIYRIIFLAGLIAVWLPLPARGQAPSEYANVAVRISEARKANAFLMRQYNWTSRTEIMDQGQVKDTRIESVSYTPDGQLTRSLLNDQNAPLPRGFLRRAIAENKRQEMEEYLKGLQGLLEQYTLSTTGKILDFIMSANRSVPDANDVLLMTGSNVVLPGDSLSMWTDMRTRHTRKIQVSTFYQGDVAQLTATFNTLPSGLNYVAYAEATVPVKQLSVQVHNFDYNRIIPAPVPQVTVQPLPPATMPAPPPAMAAPPPAAAPSLQTVEQKLRDLKSLFDQGLISQSDYDAKKAQILQGL